METISARIDTSAGGRLRAELESILQRLQRDGDVPHSDLSPAISSTLPKASSSRNWPT
jgi:hypothetical protein